MIELHGCSRCAGIFLDHASGKRFVETVDRAVLQIAERADRVARAPVDLSRAGIPCPMCKRPMSRTAFGSAQVNVDVCSQHGTWVDRGELHSIAESIERARGNVTASGSGDEDDAAAALKDGTESRARPAPVMYVAPSEPDRYDDSGASGSTADAIGAGLQVAAGILELIVSLAG